MTTTGNGNSSLHKSYKLSATLHGHSQDVRSVTHLTKLPNDNNNDKASNYVISASRDQSVRLWAKNSNDSNNYESNGTYSFHQHFVGCVSAVPPSKFFPTGTYTYT